ncbi:SDR family NAD(P)-dependent oxidoreductase [Qipengyuania vesicularis]|uniref:SDR family NAD(P)-dependent oxidoreductase n=1 Tax=Qipengyuania vesicularis TaxID=2867232 RepID=UPI001C871A31|nr:SDR family oxidoreductase [Qipengyuania vesicularis]MBX7526082.1 SDR family oxidoreductase [Qipengyuania vesicularis]
MTNPLDYSGKTVLVIGGTSGIGNGIAHGFRMAGAKVLVTGTRGSAGEYPDSDMEGLAFHSLDVSDRDALDAFEWPETLDVVVLCQGIARYGREEFTREGWDAVMEVNLDSLLDCANATRQKLADTGGSLLIISSIGGYRGLVGNPAYGASKAGAISMVKSLGVAFAAEGIRVNGIAPGYVHTKINDAFLSDEKTQKHIISTTPRGRLGLPEDMAGAALFLASPLADYVVGQTISVDGGLSVAS